MGVHGEYRVMSVLSALLRVHRGRAVVMASVVGAVVVLAAAAPTAKQPPAAPAPDYSTFATQYCVSCHNDRLKTGGLSLQGVGLADVPEHADVWERVARKLRSG